MSPTSKRKEIGVPHLDVYIVDLFPPVELDKQIPSDGDIIQDRINDIQISRPDSVRSKSSLNCFRLCIASQYLNGFEPALVNNK